MKTLASFFKGDSKSRRDAYRLHGGFLVGDDLGGDIEISADGKSAICKKCGEIRMVKERSMLLGTEIWTKDHGTLRGCACDRMEIEEFLKRQQADDIKRIYMDEKYMSVSKGYLSYCKFEDDFYKRLPEGTKEALRQVYGYAKSLIKGEIVNGLYLYSLGPGLCKTSAMACLRNMLLDNAKPCILTNVEEISTAFTSNPEMYASYKNVDVLIIDDIGIQDPKETWSTDMGKVNNSLYELLNTRMLKENTPTLFTSNYSIHELLERGLKPQTVDRIRGIAKKNIMKVSGSSVR